MWEGRGQGVLVEGEGEQGRHLEFTLLFSNCALHFSLDITAFIQALLQGIPHLLAVQHLIAQEVEQHMKVQPWDLVECSS